MWKNIKNVVSAVTDMVVIGSKEVSYQAGKASDATESVTSTFSTKAAALRARYEADLADRKAGIKKPEVVTETDTPKNIVSVN